MSWKYSIKNYLNIYNLYEFIRKKHSIEYLTRTVVLFSDIIIVLVNSYNNDSLSISIQINMKMYSLIYFVGGSSYKNWLFIQSFYNLKKVLKMIVVQNT